MKIKNFFVFLFCFFSVFLFSDTKKATAPNRFDAIASKQTKSEHQRKSSSTAPKSVTMLKPRITFAIGTPTGPKTAGMMRRTS